MRQANSSARLSKDFSVTGSAIQLNMTPATRHMRNNSGLENYVSVKEICNGKDDFIKSLKMDDAFYKVPKFSWSRTKFSESRTKKLDYITLFPEKVNPPPEQLVKIYAKRKHDVPGPEYYDMTKNWSKKSPHDYEQ